MNTCHGETGGAENYLLIPPKDPKLSLPPLNEEEVRNKEYRRLRLGY